MASFVESVKTKLAGILADVSTSTSPVTARSDAATAVQQMDERKLYFHLAAGTATQTAASYYMPVTENSKVVSVSLIRETGSFAASKTDYASVVLSSMAAAATTVKTTVATWDCTTDTMSTLAPKAVTPTATAVNITGGGKLVLNIAKTGAGQTHGVITCEVTLTRRNDS